MDGISSNINSASGLSQPLSPGGRPGVGGTGSSSFADALRGQIDEVSRLQQDATKAVEDLSTGKSDDVTGVMTAMEKSDLAFKTLLAIRSKLMEAYDEVKNIAL